MKKVAIAIVLLCSALAWAGKDPVPAAYNINMHVISSHRGDANGSRPRLSAIIDYVRLSPASKAEPAHHQRDRALLRRSAPPHSSHGVLCERRKRGPNHLLH